MSDKRKFRRLPLTPIPSRLFREVMVVDLSIGGAFVACDTPLARNSVLDVEIPLPGHGTIRARTKVERVGDFFEGMGTQPCMGMGLSFLEIKPEDRIVITQYLRGIYGAAEGVRRVQADLPARLRTGAQWTTGKVRELGEKGLFVATPAAAGLGDEVDCLVRLPNASMPVDTRGQVVHVGPGGADGEVGVRIEFSELSPRTSELLHAFLDEAREERESDGGGLT